MSETKNTASQNETNALALPAAGRGNRIFALIAFFAVGVLVTLVWINDPLGLRGASDDAPVTTPASAASEVYQCPMHPEVLQAEPGVCPVCRMDLQLVRGSESASETGEAGAIRIDPAVVQNTGVVSAPVRRGSIERTLRTVGVLDFNADKIHWVNSKFAGWIENVHVSYVGQRIEPNQPLFDVYSPELVTTQEEYLRALDYKDSLRDAKRVETQRQADRLLESTRDRLSYLGVDEEQIDVLARTRQVERLTTVRSPVAGVVTEILNESLEGMYAAAGLNLYKIADLSSLWVHADVFQSDLPWIRKGQSVEVRFPSHPQTVRQGTVLFLYPELARETRTLKICVEIPNVDGRLRAGMYADVVVEGPGSRNALLIPRHAVIRTGARNVVLVDLGEGRFAPRDVELGLRSPSDEIEVLSGLEEGQRVVTRAQFMLDSESRLQEALAKFTGGQP